MRRDSWLEMKQLAGPSLILDTAVFVPVRFHVDMYIVTYQKG